MQQSESGIRIMPAIELAYTLARHVRVYVELVSKGARGVPKTAVTSNYPVGTTWATWYPCSLRTARKHPYVGLLTACNAPRINSLLK